MRLRLIAVAGAALGPLAGWLYQAGFFGRHDVGIWIVVALAIGGVAVGAHAVFRGARAVGTVCLVVNAGVVVVYGFPTIYLHLGGAR